MQSDDNRGVQAAETTEYETRAVEEFDNAQADAETAHIDVDQSLETIANGATQSAGLAGADAEDAPNTDAPNTDAPVKTAIDRAIDEVMGYAPDDRISAAMALASTLSEVDRAVFAWRYKDAIASEKSSTAKPKRTRKATASRPLDAEVVAARDLLGGDARHGFTYVKHESATGAHGQAARKMLDGNPDTRHRHDAGDELAVSGILDTRYFANALLVLTDPAKAYKETLRRHKAAGTTPPTMVSMDAKRGGRRKFDADYYAQTDYYASVWFKWRGKFAADNIPTPALVRERRLPHVA